MRYTRGLNMNHIILFLNEVNWRLWILIISWSFLKLPLSVGCGPKNRMPRLMFAVTVYACNFGPSNFSKPALSYTLFSWDGQHVASSSKFPCNANGTHVFYSTPSWIALAVIDFTTDAHRLPYLPLMTCWKEHVGHLSLPLDRSTGTTWGNVVVSDLFAVENNSHVEYEGLQYTFALLWWPLVTGWMNNSARFCRSSYIWQGVARAH